MKLWQGDCSSKKLAPVNNLPIALHEKVYITAWQHESNAIYKIQPQAKISKKAASIRARAWQTQNCWRSRRTRSFIEQM